MERRARVAKQQSYFRKKPNYRPSASAAKSPCAHNAPPHHHTPGELTERNVNVAVARRRAFAVGHGGDCVAMVPSDEVDVLVDNFDLVLPYRRRICIRFRSTSAERAGNFETRARARRPLCPQNGRAGPFGTGEMQDSRLQIKKRHTT